MVGTRAMATECISQTRVHAYRVHVDGNTTYGAIAHRCMPIGCVPIHRNITRFITMVITRVWGSNEILG